MENNNVVQVHEFQWINNSMLTNIPFWGWCQVRDVIICDRGKGKGFTHRMMIYLWFISETSQSKARENLETSHTNLKHPKQVIDEVNYSLQGFSHALKAKMLKQCFRVDGNHSKSTNRYP